MGAEKDSASDSDMGEIAKGVVERELNDRLTMVMDAQNLNGYEDGEQEGGEVRAETGHELITITVDGKNFVVHFIKGDDGKRAYVELKSGNSMERIFSIGARTRKEALQMLEKDVKDYLNTEALRVREQQASTNAVLGSTMWTERDLQFSGDFLTGAEPPTAHATLESADAEGGDDEDDAPPLTP